MPTSSPAPVVRRRPTRDEVLAHTLLTTRPQPGSPLRRGQLIRSIDGRAYQVEYVNYTRAFCRPLSSAGIFTVPDPTTGRVKEIQTVGRGISISPRAHVEHLVVDELTDFERRHVMDPNTTTSTTNSMEAPAAVNLNPTKAAKAAPARKNPGVVTDAKPSKLKAAVESKAEAKAKAKAKADAAKEKLAAKKDRERIKKEAKQARESERKQKLAAKKAEQKAAAAARKEARAAVAAAKRQTHPCKCGCGEETTAHFVQGHDARFKGWLLRIERGEMAVKDLPVEVQKAYKWVKKGDGVIPTTNYKGEKHTGYDKT